VHTALILVPDDLHDSSEVLSPLHRIAHVWDGIDTVGGTNDTHETDMDWAVAELTGVTGYLELLMRRLLVCTQLI
jgi:hypothetical protein